MRVYQVPIEPLPERYSTQWRGYFQEDFSKAGLPYLVINGQPLTDKIEQGRFLDIIGTNYYKSSQLAKICKLIHRGHVTDEDVFLFHDLWFPGIEMLAYMRDALDLRFRIYGCLHAGTYDPYDFLAQKYMAGWGEHIEKGWFKFVDGIFVATKFHKGLLCGKRGTHPDKVHITGFPIRAYGKPKPSSYVDKTVVFPHRLDPEKGPDFFEHLRDRFHFMLPDVNFVRTMDHWKGSKKDYYRILRTASVAVSFAQQETWGIAMQEALFRGCYPLVPDRLSYTEMYPACFRFTSFDECVGKLISLLSPRPTIKYQWKQTFNDLKRKGKEAIPNMIYVINNERGG